MKWCERRDSNSHGSPRWNLNPVRLPIPPLSQSGWIIIQYFSLVKTQDESLALNLFYPKNWGERWDSNPRQPGSQPGALPTELRSPKCHLFKEMP